MENLTLSRRYASALFQELKTNVIKKKVIGQFKEIVELAEVSKEFANIITNPTITNIDKGAIFGTLFKKKKFDKSLLNFILILLENNRLSLIAPICKIMDDMLMEAVGEIKVEVIFASKPTPSVRSAVSKKIAVMTKRKVIMDEVIDPSIISGVVIRYGSTLIDASVQGSIDTFLEQYA